MPRERDYWFPAKRYGWGWGAPVTWQGWVAMLSCVGATIVGAFSFPPTVSLLGFGLAVLVPSAVLMAICYVTGEQPRWRWGDDDRR